MVIAFHHRGGERELPGHGARVLRHVERRAVLQKLAKVSPKSHTPARALAAQTGWACLLTLTGTFDQLFTYVIFAGWIFYLLGAVAVFIFRAKYPDLPRPYRVPGYPAVPILFVLAATWFVINTVIEQPADSMVGIVLVLSGIPFYLYWKARTGGRNGVRCRAGGGAAVMLGSHPALPRRFAPRDHTPGG